jgi:UDP-N-acetylmuramyl pentapeptide phosphotransferase/UDP-N-acetylglucosamine-1-phosphate transferase
MALGALVLGAAASAMLTPLVVAALRRVGHKRPNFRGQAVVNSAGLVLPVPLALGLLALSRGGREAIVGTSLAVAFALLGLIDDVWGSRSVGGLRGHFRALLKGQVTTGAVKAIGGGTAALATGMMLQVGAAPGVFLVSWGGRAVLTAALIALAANAVNLLDLRPLRALKGFAFAAVPLWGWLLLRAPLSAAATGLGALIGAVLAYAPWEARQQAMLGDAGANLLGAFLGFAAASTLPWPAQLAAVAGLAALHWYSERHSFSAWIRAHPAAAALDAWGWEA